MDVKEMSGTEGFLDFPVNISKCQNEESVLECRSKKYLEHGLNECDCIPHQLRTYYKTVRYLSKFES